MQAPSHPYVMVGILSVPAEEFEAFIVAHGGVVVPAGAECTHLVR